MLCICFWAEKNNYGLSNACYVCVHQVLDSEGTLSDLQDLLLNLRKAKGYGIFLDRIVGWAYGIHCWKEKIVNKKVSSFELPSFEAFVLLGYENCYDTYMDEDQCGKKLKVFKWTASHMRSTKNQGWPEEAIERYNDFFKRIVADRGLDTSRTFEEAFMMEMRDKYSSKKREKQKNQAMV